MTSPAMIQMPSRLIIEQRLRGLKCLYLTNRVCNKLFPRLLAAFADKEFEAATAISVFDTVLHEFLREDVEETEEGDTGDILQTFYFETVHQELIEAVLAGDDQAVLNALRDAFAEIRAIIDKS